MRAYQLPKGGAGIEALTQGDRPDLTPAYRQVLVQVKACALNFRDLALPAVDIACRYATTSSRFLTAPVK